MNKLRQFPIAALTGAALGILSSALQGCTQYSEPPGWHAPEGATPAGRSLARWYVQEALTTVRSLGYRAPRAVPIRVNLTPHHKGQIGYTAWWALPSGDYRFYIQVEPEWWASAPADKRRALIMHEICHVAVVSEYGHGGHGVEWQACMVRAGQSPDHGHKEKVLL